MRWIIIVCAVLVGGWFLFDGVRALVVGDYVTPRTGPHAGQLGPWSKLVARVGIEPRSDAMKGIFAGFGSVWMVVLVCYALSMPWAWWGMLAAAVLSLWYLPFGTVVGLVQIVLLLIQRRGG